MKTLIIAVTPLARLEDMAVCLILCVHKDNVDPQAAIKAAFNDWADTAEGKGFIEDNGMNWGDSLDIPDEFLNKHGIEKYDGLLGGSKLLGILYDNEIMVDHDEQLAG